jgi:HlyD family secretion protein
MSLTNGRLPRIILILLICATAMLAWAVPVAVAQHTDPSAVSALGRLEPEGGVLRIAAASTSHAISGSIITELLVKEGDWVEANQLLATTDSTELLQVLLRKAEAELEQVIRAVEAASSQADEACTLADTAASEASRRANLLERKLTSTEEAERAQGDAEAKAASCTAAHANVRVAESAIKVAQSTVALNNVEVERSMVHAPVAGRILEIYAGPGESSAPDGVLDLGRTDHMFAIAEVYETDIGSVSIGQSARVTSDALPKPLTGTVERIRGQVRKQDVIGTDPAARKDARIIEVEIRLDDSSLAAGLTNLQVEIVIGG